MDPTAAVINNAIFDAVGVRVKTLPITPEKILRARLQRRKPSHDPLRLPRTDDAEKSASRLMEKHGDDGRVIAGGTSLLIMMRQRLLMPKVVISLARIPKFDRISFNAKEGLRIGAGARHRDIELSPVIKKHYPAPA